MKRGAIILASKSASRRAMLEAAGLAFEALPAHLDEAAIADRMLKGGQDPRAIARALAEAKALTVSADHPAQWVIGSDSMVWVDGRLFDKPASRAQAADHLRCFSGRVIVLDSAVALARDGKLVDWASEDAHLEVRPLSDSFIEAYLDAEWPAIAACVGCFRIEGRGIQLFENIFGNHFTILGMPLLPLLAILRTHKVLAT